MKYTEEQAIEYVRCMEDIKYFAEKYIKIRYHTAYGLKNDKSHVSIVLNDTQKNVVKDFNIEPQFFSLEARMSGKTTIAAIIILHQSIFREYFTSGIFTRKMINGQYIMELIYDMYENLPDFLKLGAAIIEGNKRKTEFENFASIHYFGSNVFSTRGRTINLMYLDEYEWISNKDEIKECLLPYVGINSKMFGLSTAKPIFAEAEGVPV